MTYSALKSELRNRVVAILSENELASIGEYIPVELVCMVNTKEPDTVIRQTQNSV
jgi:tRNA(Ser,Leu) C12 N-acetylase TAN1